MAITAKGQAFSTDATTNDIYFRTDTDMRQWYTYDGATWFSAQVYESKFSGNLSTDATYAFNGRVENTTLYIEDVDISTRVITTNDSDNFWTITIDSFTPTYPAGASNQIASVLTDSDSPSSDFINHDADVSVTTGDPTTYGMFAVTTASTGTPSDVYVLANVRYRKVVT